MKNVIYSALLFAAHLLCAQNKNDKTIYLDSLSKETTQGNHSFYIIIKDYQKDLPEYETVTYYKSGKISRVAKIKNKNTPNSTTGLSIGYYENGNKRNENSSFDPNNPVAKNLSWYENGNPERETIIDFKKNYHSQKEYYENGKPKVIEEYNFNRTNKKSKKIIQFWNKNGDHLVINGNGNYFFEDDKTITQGKVKDSLKDGLWIETDKKNHCRFEENYINGIFYEGKNFTKKGDIITYKEIETQAQPKHGFNDFTQYISKNFKYSTEAVNNKVKGRIIVELVVEKDGSLNEIKIIKGLGYGLDEEAVRIVSSYGKWIPAQQRGENIIARFSIPIAVSLK